jgi:hypothetical protein
MQRLNTGGSEEGEYGCLIDICLIIDYDLCALIDVCGVYDGASNL